MGRDRPNPMQPVRKAKVDTFGRLRYLSPAEEQRVRPALEDRDESRRDGRRRFNAWRAERGYKTLPPLGTYADHLTPIVLLALNTGLRRGELLALTWADVDLTGARLTVQGASAKSGLTRYLPLNSEAITRCGRGARARRPRIRAGCRVPRPGRRTDVLAEDGVETDCDGREAVGVHLPRFAAHLRVEAGAGRRRPEHRPRAARACRHQDDAGYAHLAPEHKAAAVAKLVARVMPRTAKSQVTLQLRLADRQRLTRIGEANLRRDGYLRRIVLAAIREGREVQESTRTSPRPFAKHKHQDPETAARVVLTAAEQAVMLNDQPADLSEWMRDHISDDRKRAAIATAAKAIATDTATLIEYVARVYVLGRPRTPGRKAPVPTNT